MIDFAKLSAPFNPSLVSWRVGSTFEKDGKARGMALAYIDARDVQDRLDDVCGPAGWQCRYSHANTKTVCDIGIDINANVVPVDNLVPPLEPRWVWKANGAGDSDFEAEKGALSDAFKRAAVCWGIGRYLYDIRAPWVDVEKRGKSFVIADNAYPILLKVLTDHFERWKTAADPKTAGAVKAELESREDVTEQWRLWATGEEGQKWFKAFRADLGNATSMKAIDGFVGSNKKFLDAFYKHAPDRYKTVAKIIDDARDGFKARTAA